MRTLAAIVVVASLVTGIALVIDVPAQQTAPAPAAQPAQPAGDQAAQPSASPSAPAAQPSAPSASPSTEPTRPSVQITPPSPPPPTAAPSPGGAPAQPASTDGRQLQVDASAVLGSTVRNADGKDIGRVSRLMMDPREGKIATVVIGIGGMLGIGEKLVSLPWNAVRVTQDRGQVVVVADQRLLEQAPAAERKADKGGEPAASPSTSAGNGSQNSQKK
jgi:sporulation protein YlmC with PRC-barrel domain